MWRLLQQRKKKLVTYQHAAPVFSSVQYLSQLSHCGDMRDDSAEILFLSFLPKALSCEHFWHGCGCPLFDVVHPPFPLPTTASPTLQGALKGSLGEAGVACNMPKPCKLPAEVPVDPQRS